MSLTKRQLMSQQVIGFGFESVGWIWAYKVTPSPIGMRIVEIVFYCGLTVREFAVVISNYKIKLAYGSSVSVNLEALFDNLIKWIDFKNRPDELFKITPNLHRVAMLF